MGRISKIRAVVLEFDENARCGRDGGEAMAKAKAGVDEGEKSK